MSIIKTKLTVFLLTTFILFCFLFFPALSFAQEEAGGWGTVCLERELCEADGGCCDVTGCSGQPSHRLKLTFPPYSEFDPPISPNSRVYIMECIDTSGEDTFESQTCTTGRSESDILLLGVDNAAILRDTLSKTLETKMSGLDIGDTYFTGYDFWGLYYFGNNQSAEPQPFLADESGMLPGLDTNGASPPQLEWDAFTPKSYSRKMYAVYELPSAGGGEEVVEQDDEERTQQQGTIDVEPTPTYVPEEDQNCISIAWDPYGRVFDSRSLEPITEAIVELQKKRDNGGFTRVNPNNPNDVLSSVLKNPYLTEGDGYFSFIVKDATYKLDLPSNFNKNISIVTDIAKIHPNYTKIYSEIYPAKTGVEIVQQGVIQHRDIPVEVKGDATNNPVKLMEGSYELGKQSGKLYVAGRASHPFTMVKAYSKKISSSPSGNVRSRLLQTISSDNFGRFSFIVDQNSLDKGEYFGEVELEKTDLTTFQLSGNKKIISVNPILNYVEGYAYDEKGKVIPNATISVSFSFSSKPFYQTQADDKGYYRISSVNLPSLPYNIKYSLPNGQMIKVNTTKFINDNTKYITSGKINLYEKNNKVKTPSFSLKSTNLRNQPTVAQNNINQNGSKNDMTLIVIVILVLILGAVVMIGVYLFQKNKQASF